jgi:CubicO group peptidase (beta-lactamase class C family)
LLTAESGGHTPAVLAPELDRYVAESLRAWEIPGAALAVVQDGRVLVAKGYGVRELGRSDPVDADTIFDIASLTKAFTAAAIATLVDEGKLAWDAPIRTYVPQVEFSDPYVTANMSLRDLLSHRSGLRNNAAPFRGHLTRQQVMQLFKHLQPWEPFRKRMVYSNIGYALAGEIASQVSGLTWEELVTKRLIEPLALSRTTADYDAAPRFGNVASGHVMAGRVQRPAPRGSERLSTAAAGAIHSSARDLATWMRFQLGDGRFNGNRILSADAMSEMHSPHVLAPTTSEFRASRQLHNFAGYGLGWQVWDYRGYPVLWHSGNGDGQVAYVVLVPGARLGVAITTNSWRTSASPLHMAMAARILDHYLGLPTRDYVAERKALSDKAQEQEDRDTAALEASRVKNSNPTLPLSAYTGQYRDQLGLGVRIAVHAGSLRLTYAGGEVATLEHWHGDMFRVSWPNPFSQGRPVFVRFDIHQEGKVSGLRMELMRDLIEAVRMSS